MIKLCLAIVLMGAVQWMGVTSLFAVSPSILILQGKITDITTGVPTGLKSVTIRLVSIFDNQTTVWQETKTVNFDSGVFKVTLGDINSITRDVLDISEPTFFMRIDNQDIRVPIFSVPYSLQAQYADQAYSVSWNNVVNQPSVGSLSGTLNATQIPSQFIKSSMLDIGAVPVYTVLSNKGLQVNSSQ